MAPSFKKGLVIMLRKKGDSDNAIDYRPITLLQSSYEILARIITFRVQVGLATIIGHFQQGFVKTRLLEMSLVLMQAMFHHAYDDERQSINEAPPITLLDFTKAYDSLNRSFVLLMLRKFGFSAEFVRLVEQMHCDTTAQFSVNGELSNEIPVVSGIRQGCPLAPLLFIIAAEALALMVNRDTGI